MIDVFHVLQFSTKEIQKIENEKDVVFSPGAKSFIKDAILESLASTDLGQFDNEDVTNLLQITFDSIRNELVFQSNIIIDIAELSRIIHKRWCNVYPFCKSLG